jgi:hypothetical protein
MVVVRFLNFGANGRAPVIRYLNSSYSFFASSRIGKLKYHQPQLMDCFILNLKNETSEAH